MESRALCTGCILRAHPPHANERRLGHGRLGHGRCELAAHPLCVLGASSSCTWTARSAAKCAQECTHCRAVNWPRILFVYWAHPLHAHGRLGRRRNALKSALIVALLVEISTPESFLIPASHLFPNSVPPPSPHPLSFLVSVLV